MGGDHGLLDILMTQELLPSPAVISVRQEMGGEGMAQCVRGDRLCQTGGAGCATHRPLKYCRVHAVTADYT